MQLRTAWIAIVFLVTTVRADGPGEGRGDRTPVDPARFASDAPALTARIDAVLAARWAEPRSARRRSPTTENSSAASAST